MFSKKIIKPKGFNSTLLFVPLFAVVAMVSIFVILPTTNKADASSVITPPNCINASFYYNSDVTAFVRDYRHGRSGKLVAYLECGKGATFTKRVYKFAITTSNNKISVALENYLDTQPPPYSVTHPEATLTGVDINKKTAMFNCSKFIFNLYL